MARIRCLKTWLSLMRGAQQRNLSFSGIRKDAIRYADIIKENRFTNGLQRLEAFLDDIKLGQIHEWENEIRNSESIKSQDELENRSMKDSEVEVILPFSTNTKLRNDFTSVSGRIRVGKLLHDLDTVAAWCGAKYYKGPSVWPPFRLGTGFVDSIDFNGPNSIDIMQDLRLKAFASWVGKTSIEITILVEQLQGSGEWEQKAETIFVCVAKLLKDGKPAFFNKMIPQDDVEKEYFNRGELNEQKRKKEISESLLKKSPTEHEKDIMHNMFLGIGDQSDIAFEDNTKPENSVWMRDTLLKNMILCHPGSRNVYNYTFGGFLMEQAFDLAWATACAYMKCKPVITNIENITIKAPVEVGSLLCLSSIIVYTSENHGQVQVSAEVYDPKTGSYDDVVTFFFCFAADKVIPQILPKTYAEYVLYLEGRRLMPKNLLID